MPKTLKLSAIGYQNDCTVQPCSGTEEPQNQGRPLLHSQTDTVVARTQPESYRAGEKPCISSEKLGVEKLEASKTAISHSGDRSRFQKGQDYWLVLVSYYDHFLPAVFLSEYIVRSQFHTYSTSDSGGS